jgi:peptidylprolyl isomerase
MKSKSVSTFIALLCVLALAVVVSGCGGDGAGLSSIDAQAPTPATSDEAAEEESDSSDEKAGEIPKVTGDAGEKPEIAETSGAPPEELVSEDIIEGDGAEAKEGDTVSVQYVGKNWSNSEEFDTSWTRGEPFEFTLGEGGVIAGWDQGVVGMKEGGRRLLVIPPDLGYGAQGQGSIPANETLVFVVDLEKVS